MVFACVLIGYGAAVKTLPPFLIRSSAAMACILLLSKRTTFYGIQYLCVDWVGWSCG